MILMADHEITNSASVLLSTASTLADPYSCCAAATLSGNGILHGGAIEVAYKQLDVLTDLNMIPMLIEAVKAGKMRLFGYGHRKWKVSPPCCVPKLPSSEYPCPLGSGSGDDKSVGKTEGRSALTATQLPDPRSILFREMIADAMLDMESLRTDHHLAAALEIDRVASQDEYFKSRNLHANADLFLSFAYKSM